MTDKGDLIATDASAALIHVPPPPELAASELKGRAPLDAVSLERAAASEPREIALDTEGARRSAVLIAELLTK